MSLLDTRDFSDTSLCQTSTLPRTRIFPRRVAHHPCASVLPGCMWPFVSVCSTLLLLLSRFSHVRLCATPGPAAHQAPPSLGFSMQEHWSGLHFLLQCMKVKSESDVAQSCPTPSDPMDCSLPGSSVHGIFQARVLEWGAIAFSSSTLHQQKGFLL